MYHSRAVMRDDRSFERVPEYLPFVVDSDSSFISTSTKNLVHLAHHPLRLRRTRWNYHSALVIAILGAGSFFRQTLEACSRTGREGCAGRSDGFIPVGRHDPSIALGRRFEEVCGDLLVSLGFAMSVSFHRWRGEDSCSMMCLQIVQIHRP